MNTAKIQNAIISCSEKRGLKEFVSELLKINPEMKIYSSSGTYRELAAVAGNNLVKISSYTGFAEMPGGLVKTLNPKIHAGILADINDAEQQKYLRDNDIETFDLIVANLYPFQKVAEQGSGFEEARRNIDIGGVSLLEAGSKNMLRVAVVVDPNDYEEVLKVLKNNNGSTKELRLKLAQKAFASLSQYLTAISNYFSDVRELP